MLRTARLWILLSLALALTPLGARGQPAPIVGGTPVPYGAWPDVVAVSGAFGTCTGTLIAPDVVLTAGHCIDIEPIEIVAGTTDYAVPDAGERIAVQWARAYPRWEERYDVGVLVLERAASPRVRPIASACLANEQLARGASLTIVGFGLVTHGGADDNTRLHEAVIPVLDAFCETAPGCESAVRPKGEIAAGGRGVDSCFGDSGGPAFLDTPAGPALVGIVSRGLAIPGLPCGNGGIYVRADKVVSWAQSVTGRRFSRAACDRGDDPESTSAPSRAAEEDELDQVGGCASGRGVGGAGLVLAAIALALRPRRGRRDTTRGHGQDQGEEPRRRDGRRRDDAHHLEVHQGQADPSVPRHRPEVLRSRDREP